MVLFRYAQSKIDIAPDTILVDREIAAVIEEQQQWIREQFPEREPRFLFVQRISNLAGTKPYSPGTYGRWLRDFSAVVAITDSTGRAVGLSHTHRFRHTKLTRLAELGLPIKVLQRYAGHATPTMSMHYVAQREEHAEQAFLATVKLRADGTRVRFSREDHDNLHLFDRADRFLPHGWCLLPPLQTCDKGNACLTCSVFVTDDSHRHRPRQVARRRSTDQMRQPAAHQAGGAHSEQRDPVAPPPRQSHVQPPRRGYPATGRWPSAFLSGGVRDLGPTTPHQGDRGTNDIRRTRGIGKRDNDTARHSDIDRSAGRPWW